MVFRHFVEVGHVHYISSGPRAGKLVATVDVIDQNRALIDAPCTQVRRQTIQTMPLKCMQLTDFNLRFPHSAHQKYVRQAWQKGNINTKWTKIEARERKTKMTDFDHFKVVKAMRNRIIKNEVKKLQKGATAAAAAAKITAAGKKAPAQEFPAKKATGQKAALPPKAQKGQKAPAQKAPAPKAFGKKEAIRKVIKVLFGKKKDRKKERKKRRHPSYKQGSKMLDCLWILKIALYKHDPYSFVSLVTIYDKNNQLDRVPLSAFVKVWDVILQLTLE
uniref:Large ribosomal subunit protein eL14 n=1 Tax=Mandrillus leucophaeus TaxID=9568 RepID=A0A2K6A1J1_MANLE